MKFTSLEEFGLDAKKLVLLGVAVSALAGTLFRVVIGEVLGTATTIIELAMTVVVFYIVVSSPKRMQKAAAMSQAREAVSLSVLAKACLTVSGSRARTVLLLESRESAISRALNLAKKKVLLGYGVKGSLDLAASRLSSYSASNVLKGLSGLSPHSISDRGEESAGLARSSGLSFETKFPVFMTVCFFAPILLLLYSVFSHLANPEDFAVLTTVEFVMLDIAFYLCSNERRPRE